MTPDGLVAQRHYVAAPPSAKGEAQVYLAPAALYTHDGRPDSLLLLNNADLSTRCAWNVRAGEPTFVLEGIVFDDVRRVTAFYTGLLTAATPPPRAPLSWI